MKVYFILDSVSNAVKIGKANDIELRLSALQVGNPNQLNLIHEIDCDSEDQSYLLERQLHNKYSHLRLVGEWFKYDESTFKEIFEKTTIYCRKNKRESVEMETVFGTESFCNEKFPRCFFYPHLLSHIMMKYEDSVRLRNPFRTMKYPTEGQQMLLPWSPEKDKVFISDRKHRENMKLKRFLDDMEADRKNSVANDLGQFL